MSQHYGGVIWTNHALKRLKERGIKQQDAFVAFRNADRSRYAASKGGWVYDKTFGNTTIEVVAKQNERKEWVILSVWEKSAGASYRKNQPLLLRLFRQIVFGNCR